MQVTKKISHKKTISTIIISVMVLSVLAYGYFSYSKSWWPFEQSAQNNTESTSRGVNSIDYSGPTDEDIEHSQDGKKNSTETPNEGLESDKDNTSAKTSASIGIAFADVVNSSVEIRAFTPSVIEGDGKCTAQLTKGSTEVTESSSAFIDSTSSQCQPIIIPISKFNQSGSWSLVVMYDSSTSRGISDSISVVLP